MQSDAWESSAFLWTYDDWGGWYDHVPPPIVDRMGLRLPGALAPGQSLREARPRRQHRARLHLGLKFIEENWDLRSLARRGRASELPDVGLRLRCPAT